MKLIRGRFGGIKLALVGIVATAVIAYAGYQIFFARTGEAAVALIPSDASCVVTLDTHPSQAQLAAFTKLANALKREGVDTEIEDGVNDMIGKAGIAKEVRQYLTNNMASAWWNGLNGKDTHAVGLFSISDPKAVAAILATGAAENAGGITVYRFGQSGMVTAIVGDYLAIASDPQTIQRVEVTRTGGGPSVANLADYRAARAALPDDANLMVFVAPSALNEMMGVNYVRAENRPNLSMWMSFGASLRDGGIQFDYRGPLDKRELAGLQALSGMAPLNHDLLKKLPPDAYGLVAYSSLDKIFTAAKGTVEHVSGQQSAQKSEAEFEKSTGLSIENDLIPAFKGDVVLAIYPGVGNPDKSYDGVLLVDSANGGTPAALADKVRAFIEKQSAESAAKDGKPPMRFVEHKVGQVTIWSLDDASAMTLRKSLGGNPEANGVTTFDPMFGDKTISYAVSNGSVVVASSEAMMTKALLTLNGDKSLAEDPAFADMALRVNEKDQGMIMCSLSRIAERFRPEWEKSMKDSAFTPDDLINLFGGPNAGLVGSGRVEGDTVTASMFLPLDFDRMAKLARSIKDQEKKAEKDVIGKPEIPPYPSMPPDSGTLRTPH